MDILLLIVNIFWFIAPSYVANGFPPLMRGKRPLDFGRKVRNHRILGDSKTLEGTIGGIMFGFFIGTLQVIYQDTLPFRLYDMTFPLVIAMVFGTMAGDIIGSFIKRRAGFNSGDSAMLLDQLGFLLAALVLASLVQPIEPYIILTLIAVTPPIHMLTNFIGCHVMKVKNNPW